jgi:hypothetical protein
MIELSFGDAIALAGAFFQSRTVEDGDTAACILDEPGPFERIGGVRYARPSHSEHHGEKLLGEREIARLHTILRHQEPAATPLFQKVKCIASCRLCDLVEECVGIVEHRPLHEGVPLQLRSE